MSDALRAALGAGIVIPLDLGEQYVAAQVFDASAEMPAAWIEMLADVDEATCMSWDRFCDIMAMPSILGVHRRELGHWGWTSVTPIVNDPEGRVLNRLRKFDHPSNRKHG